MRIHFISPQEHLMIWNCHGEHISVKGSEDLSLKNIDEVFGYLDTPVHRIFRVSPLFILDDVTEEVAHRWLAVHGEHPDETDVSKMGTWLLESEAWADYPQAFADSHDSGNDEHRTY